MQFAEEHVILGIVVVYVVTYVIPYVTRGDCSGGTGYQYRKFSANICVFISTDEKDHHA
jgi:hypothetical protein